MGECCGVVNVSLDPPIDGLISIASATVGNASRPIYTGGSGYALWTIRAASVTTGGTVLIEGCEKNSDTAADWYTISTVPVTANGTLYVVVPMGEVHQYQRSRISARTDGTYWTTVSMVPLVTVLTGRKVSP